MAIEGVHMPQIVGNMQSPSVLEVGFEFRVESRSASGAHPREHVTKRCQSWESSTWPKGSTLCVEGYVKRRVMPISRHACHVAGFGISQQYFVRVVIESGQVFRSIGAPLDLATLHSLPHSIGF